MGQKVHPFGFRLGVIRDWQSRWYADKEYKDFAIEDDKIRKFLRSRLQGMQASSANRRGGRQGRGMDAGVSQIEIERMANIIKVTMHTARPGIIIGRGGRGIDELRNDVEKMTPRKVQINVLEIKQPELDAQLVAESISTQIERRVSFKRAIRLAIARTMQRGGKGIKVLVSGRLGGAEIARSYGDKDGKIPLHTLRADIDYGAAEARTQYGNIGVKVWIYRGEILPGTTPAGAPVQRVSAVRPAAAAPAPAVAAPGAQDKRAKGWRRVSREASATTEDTAQTENIETPAPVVVPVESETLTTDTAAVPTDVVQAEVPERETSTGEGETA